MTTATASWVRVGTGCGSSIPAGCRHRRFSSLSLKTTQQQQRRRPPQAVLMAESASASASTTAAFWSTTTTTSFLTKGWHHEDVSQCVTPEKLDHWLRDSIAEIVRNIGEAPFLVHMFSRGRGSNARPRLEREAATPEVWSSVTRRWGQESRTPDGIVLVEELIRDDDDDEEELVGSDHRQRTWGLLVQGRGMESLAACYILSTCRVGFCTHFCLVRAKCFGESIDKQLRRAWLQQQPPPPPHR